ncbi:hypothetical protein CBM2589_B180015 [Cupriavidus taiwanensis]|uniref:Uncharacterized protein n=1 Tax=Cupriavidus taiwanensis TaxID=164546 RepID=A0A375BKN4_9BURK|nr:hypothetical protein [Cupriavidus taiwanensis]SOY47261.1 hypothetical protein CBM2589_B180015 [Cupriavidus taiwanensis]
MLALAQRHPLVFAQVFDFSAPERASHSGALSGATVLAADDAWMCHAPGASGYIGNFFTAKQQPCTGHVTPSPDPMGRSGQSRPLSVTNVRSIPCWRCR